MQVPFHNAYNNNQRFPPPNQFQWRHNFVPRGPQPHFRTPPPRWRQPSPQEYANEFWCETCDRGFSTSDILEKHRQQHQKCNIDGCQFIAHPKVITKHIQMQHASGLYKKIAKLQDPEEIKKWREERKKRYPTKENVEKAAAAIKEKINRGEKIGLRPNRHDRNQQTVSGIGGKRKPFDKQNMRSSHCNQTAPEHKRRKNTPRNTVPKIPIVEDTRKLKPFAGIQELMIDTNEELDEPECGFTIEDEEEDQPVDAGTPSDPASGSVCLALSSLICNYGSSDEDENDIAPTIISTTSTITNNKTESDKTASQGTEKPETILIKVVEKPVSVQTTIESDDDSGPEEVKMITPVNNEAELTEIKPIINKRKPKDNIRKKPVFTRPKPKLPSTLLQKLLFKEMKHERNVVLQCIRHIIRNNFFDKSV